MPVRKKAVKKAEKKMVKKTVKRAPATKAPAKKKAVKKTAKSRATPSTTPAKKKTATKKSAKAKKTKVAEVGLGPVEPVELPPTNVTEPKEKKSKELASAIFAAEQVICDPSDAARDLYAQSRFGATLEDGKIQLSLIESLYLLEKGKLIVKDLRGRIYDSQQFIKKAKKIEPNFWIRFSVFKDMRNRGYVVKTALKFGADFRVYDRGIKPGEDHARWVLYPIHEGTTLTWHEFAAKARVAHSTKKRLLIGIVDDEGDVTYYEIKWMRP